MIRVGFAGLPGSGKTSTARALSGNCVRNKKFTNIELISEAAREYIARYGNIDSIFDEYLILEHQMNWEDRFPNLDLMITDSPIPLIFVYAQQLKREGNIKDSLVIEKIFKKMNELGKRYDIIFYLPPVIKPIKDAIRPDLHFDEEWRLKTDRMIRSAFDIFPPKKFVVVDEKDILNRVLFCTKELNSL